MGAVVKIDEIDDKILHLLIKDARTRLKDIAKECNTSSVSVLNRIKRLKRLGVITGATLFPHAALIDLQTTANIGINLNSNEANEDEIIKLLDEQINLVEPSASVGKYDLCALVFTENVSELDKAVYAVRKCVGVRKIDVNIYSGEPHFVFENINLRPKGI
jgi:DNA-binding Lrp family transcriptional regulator